MIDAKAKEAAEAFAARLREMRDDQRIEAIQHAVETAGICKECGRDDGLHCQCWNDE